MIGGSSRSAVWVLLGLVACRATPPGDRVVPSGGEAGPLASRASIGSVPTAGPTTRSLGRSLSRVREHFEAGRGRTRILALLDHRLRGVEAVRGLVARAGADDVHVTLIWDEEPLDEDWARGLPGGDRVAAFVDRRRVAGRVFARGLLPTSRARELYLVYGPEARWPASPDGTAAGVAAGPVGFDDEGPPAPRCWWHRMGRLAPAHRVADLDELGERLAASVLSRPVGR